MTRRTDAPSWRRAATASMTLVAALAVLAACSTASDSTPSGSTGPGNAVSADDLASMEAELTEAAKAPVFAPQGPAFSVASLAGKKILSMPVSSQVKTCDTISRQVVDIAKSVGMTGSTYFQNNGGPQAWVQGMNQAISQHYDGVALVCGIDPAALAPQMKAAEAAGIKVVDLHLADVSQPASPLVAGQTDGEFNKAMRLGVAAALTRANGNAVDALVVTSNENPPSPGMGETVKSEFAKYCSACKVQSINVSIPDWSTKLLGAVQSALVANPDIKAVFTVYDGQSPFVLPALKASGRDAEMYAFGLTPEVAPLMADPANQMGTNTGPSAGWLAYTGADQLFRVMAGQPAIEASKAYAPYRLFTPDNISDFTGPDGGFGTAYIDGYRALWQDAPAQ
ncbi:MULTISPECIES: sugar ABC transporter substrate-binding protein [unclassified Nocardioides]|uniref:sugar ABC transporter substrate-binding protein n=1 Tax=unclassified Nocardioides TaxID=2615069 RepID=UPI000A269630|nr:MULTISPECIES: substrate-binding domain-containing protein [unclassified Nocardioides]